MLKTVLYSLIIIIIWHPYISLEKEGETFLRVSCFFLFFLKIIAIGQLYLLHGSCICLFIGITLV